MIEPLRYHIEKTPPHSIPHAIFCQRCLSNKKTRENPGLVIKYCCHCPRCNYLCRECDEFAHSFVKTKNHIRKIVVVGPAVRKKIQRRGDSRSFPKLFDIVEIKFKSKVIHNGKCVHREPAQFLTFPSGVSGNCIHVQILGAKKLPIADSHGSSDPFVCLQFGGKRIGTTRTRPRTINPRWSNETYVIPVDRHESVRKADDILKLEVFDRDYFNFNDFLGHVEVTREQLQRLAEASNLKPIRLKLSLREYHGRLGVTVGVNGNLCYLKIIRAESLDKMDAVGLSDPFCEVFFQNNSLGRTSVVSNSLNPEWTSGNMFTLRVEDVVKEELRLRALSKLTRGHRATAGSERVTENAFIFRIQLYDHNRFRAHGDLGCVRISVDQFRRLAPDFPKTLADIPPAKALNHWLTSGVMGMGSNMRKARNSIVSIASSLTGGSRGDNEESSRSLSDRMLASAGVGLESSILEEEDEENNDEEQEEGSRSVSGSSRMADEDEELSRPAPKEPSFELDDSVPEWRRWDKDNDDSVLDTSDEEEEASEDRQNGSSIQNSVPILSMEDRSGSGSAMSSAHILRGVDGESTQIADSLEPKEKDADASPSVDDAASKSSGRGNESRRSSGDAYSPTASSSVGDTGTASGQAYQESSVQTRSDSKRQGLGDDRDDATAGQGDSRSERVGHDVTDGEGEDHDYANYAGHSEEEVEDEESQLTEEGLQEEDYDFSDEESEEKVWVNALFIFIRDKRLLTASCVVMDLFTGEFVEQAIREYSWRYFGDGILLCFS